MNENSSCCTPEDSRHSGGTDVQVGEVTTTYKITGMTCGHCEGAVSSEIGEISGVSSVQAVASTGLVTVVSKAPLDEEAVRAAVDEAGYELVGQGV
ncbi:heavy-metal-associated domain-containing protein [Streptomyces sp. NPDC059008]|uniref:heavy-metal-associated domain-containing protein n=1 Tax=Streptomyces sp. NPDC059008 TaxID=3346693 RepID=UPI0036866F37